MFKKTIIIAVLFFLQVFSAYAGSDGEINLNKKSRGCKNKDCFEKLNRATFSFNQSIDRALIKPLAKGNTENCQTTFKPELVMLLGTYQI